MTGGDKGRGKKERDTGIAAPTIITEMSLQPVFHIVGACVYILSLHFTTYN